MVTNMKNRILICFLLLLIATVAVGCSINTFAAEIYETEPFHSDLVSMVDIPKSLTIPGKVCSVEYESYRVSELTGEKLVTLKVLDTEDGTITIGENREIMSISRVGRLDQIAGLVKNDEKQLKSIVEQGMGELLDFSIYNDFSISKWEWDGTIHLIWQVRKELLCNNKAELVIDDEGNILFFAKTNACPEELKSRFISESERDDVLLEALKIKYPDLHFSKISVESEMLSLYKSRRSLICDVRAVDEDGFAYYEVIVVT